MRPHSGKRISNQWEIIQTKTNYFKCWRLKSLRVLCVLAYKVVFKSKLEKRLESGWEGLSIRSHLTYRAVAQTKNVRLTNCSISLGRTDIGMTMNKTLNGIYKTLQINNFDIENLLCHSNITTIEYPNRVWHVIEINQECSFTFRYDENHLFQWKHS
jgi:hypothetical protein